MADVEGSTNCILILFFLYVRVRSVQPVMLSRSYAFEALPHQVAF